MIRFYFASIVLTIAAAQDVVVTIDSGSLRGTTATSYHGTPYHKFAGIPFAEPPLGELRFQPPQPPASWTGTRDALEEGRACPQFGLGSEDCLYLNVYAPVNATGLPVMVWIYGGGFYSGTSSIVWYTPDLFVEHDVILVTFNYRIGIIGFLSLQNDLIPGNAGLKDQVFVLQWIQRNIAAFGGDPTQVTVFGESAGSCSVSHLFLSPATTGLFKGAIMESGQAVSTWGIVRNPRERAFRLAAALGLESQDDEEVASFLQQVDGRILGLSFRLALSDFEQRLPGEIVFGPVIEPASDSAVITEDPSVILTEGRFNQVPVITGINSADGSVVIKDNDLFNNEAMIADLTENFTLIVGAQLALDTEEERLQAAQQVEDFYFGSGGFSVENPQAVYDMFTDMYMAYPTDTFVRTLAELNFSPVFSYYFDYNGTGAIEYGVPHSGELKFLFLFDNETDKDPASLDGQTSEKMISLWTNFAKYGQPSPEGSPVPWNSFTLDERTYLDMKVDFVERQDLLEERMQLWRNILPLEVSPGAEDKSFISFVGE